MRCEEETLGAGDLVGEKGEVNEKSLVFSEFEFFFKTNLLNPLRNVHSNKYL